MLVPRRVSPKVSETAMENPWETMIASNNWGSENGSDNEAGRWIWRLQLAVDDFFVAAVDVYEKYQEKHGFSENIEGQNMYDYCNMKGLWISHCLGWLWIDIALEAWLIED